MTTKKLFLSICFIIFCFRGFSQNPQIIDTLKIHQQIKSFGLNEGLLDFNNNFFKSIVFKNDSTLLYNPNGTLHLFEIILSDTPVVSKLTNGEFHGHNFGRLLFIHDNIIYSFGGVGLFNRFSKLIYFDSSLKEWYEKQIKNYPFDSRKVVNSWNYGDKLMVLLNHYSKFDDETPNRYTNYSFGEIDLKSFEYTNHFKFERSNESEFSFPKVDFIFDSNKYSLFGSKNTDGSCRFNLFDKSSGELLFINNFKNVVFPDGNSFIYLNDSIIFYRDNMGIVDSVDINKTTIIDKKNYIKIFRSKKKGLNLFLIIGSILSVGLILIFILKFYKKEKGFTDSDNQLKEIENDLIKYKGVILSKEELDDSIKISHYSYETIKTRRSFIIKYINERGKVNIERVRKQDDKRFYEYKIN